MTSIFSSREVGDVLRSGKLARLADWSGGGGKKGGGSSLPLPPVSLFAGAPHSLNGEPIAIYGPVGLRQIKVREVLCYQLWTHTTTTKNTTTWSSSDSRIALVDSGASLYVYPHDQLRFRVKCWMQNQSYIELQFPLH